MVLSMEMRRAKAMLMTAEALLNAGCEINAADGNGRTPLMYAVKYTQPAVVGISCSTEEPTPGPGTPPG